MVQDKQVLVLRRGRDKLVLALRRGRDKQVLVRGKQELVLHDQCAEAHTLRAVRNKRGLRLSGMRGLHDRRAEVHIQQAVLHG
jgi:hypothetical protein